MSAPAPTSRGLSAPTLISWSRGEGWWWPSMWAPILYHWAGQGVDHVEVGLVYFVSFSPGITELTRMALLGRTSRWCWWWTGLSLSLLALVSWPQTCPPRGTAVRGDLPGQFDGGLDRLVNNSPGGLIIIINNWVNIFLKKYIYLGGKIQSLRTEHCHVAWQLQGLTVTAITPYSNIKLLNAAVVFR